MSGADAESPFQIHRLGLEFTGSGGNEGLKRIDHPPDPAEAEIARLHLGFPGVNRTGKNAALPSLGCTWRTIIRPSTQASAGSVWPHRLP